MALRKTRTGTAPIGGKRLLSLKERRARDRKLVVAAILDAAQESIRQDGVNGLNLQEVARMVGIQPPSLYEYFNGKNGIYDALFARGVNQFQALIFERLAYADDFEAACRAIFSTFLEFSKQCPELYLLLFEHPVPGFKPSPENIAQIEDGLMKGMAKLKTMLTRERADLPIAADDAVLLVEIMLFGLTSRMLTTEPDVDFEHSKHRNLVNAIITLLTGSRAA